MCRKAQRRRKLRLETSKLGKLNLPIVLKSHYVLPSQNPSKAKHAADLPNSSKAPARNALEKGVQKRKRKISALEDGHLDEEQMEDLLTEAPHNRHKKGKSAAAIIPESLGEELREKKDIVAKAPLRKRARDIKDDTPEETAHDNKGNDSSQGLKVLKKGAKRSKQAAEKDVDLEDRRANVSKLFSILQVYTIQSMYSESTTAPCSLSQNTSLTRDSIWDSIDLTMYISQSWFWELKNWHWQILSQSSFAVRRIVLLCLSRVEKIVWCFKTGTYVYTPIQRACRPKSHDVLFVWYVEGASIEFSLKCSKFILITDLLPRCVTMICVPLNVSSMQMVISLSM